MSPNGKNSTGTGSWFIKSTGAMNNSYVTKNRGFSPVINLKRNVIVVIGNGTIEEPYEIETN